MRTALIHVAAHLTCKSGAVFTATLQLTIGEQVFDVVLGESDLGCWYHMSCLWRYNHSKVVSLSKVAADFLLAIQRVHKHIK